MGDSGAQRGSGGAADVEGPAIHCGDWLAAQNPRCQHRRFGPDVGQYSFIDFPTDRSLIGRETLFTDPPTVDRAALHRQAARLVAASMP